MYGNYTVARGTGAWERRWNKKRSGKGFRWSVLFKKKESDVNRANIC